MATKIREQSGITIARCEEGATRAELRAAFRRKSSWVVLNAPQIEMSNYAVVLGNLDCRYPEAEAVSIQAVREAVEHGFGRLAFDRLKLVTAIPSEELSRVLRIPLRTLSRRTHFKPEESERILRVASVFQRVLEVLGGLEEARSWFTRPKRALGGKIPFDFCDTEPGAREVEHLLGRIEHGVFS